MLEKDAPLGIMTLLMSQPSLAVPCLLFIRSANFQNGNTHNLLNILLPAHKMAMTCAHTTYTKLISQNVLHWHGNMFASDMCREVSTQSIQTTAQMVLIAATVQVRH